ncbi:MAG: adenylate/guanylate cyclase domain-containing protein [Deltaproteobacteria bacterium]|nr:adenylate/guanylate cyclase domain-containing protein [Deltaproteobacteria bacterium]
MPTAYRIKPTGAEQRLEDLIQERMRAGTDKTALDQRIWDLFGEEWAVMFTDLSGFSRQVVSFGIIHFLQIIYESLRELTPCINRHDGFLLKVEADSMMVVFRRPNSALACALEMQRHLERFNQGRADEELILLCVGLGFGRMLRIGDHEVFGAEVNAASKLGEDIAHAREILVTDQFREAVTLGDGISFQPLTEVPPGARQAWRVLYR